MIWGVKTLFSETSNMETHVCLSSCTKNDYQIHLYETFHLKMKPPITLPPITLTLRKCWKHRPCLHVSPIFDPLGSPHTKAASRSRSRVGRRSIKAWKRSPFASGQVGSWRTLGSPYPFDTDFQHSPRMMSWKSISKTIQMDRKQVEIRCFF